MGAPGAHGAGTPEQVDEVLDKAGEVRTQVDGLQLRVGDRRARPTVIEDAGSSRNRPARAAVTLDQIAGAYRCPRVVVTALNMPRTLADGPEQAPIRGVAD